MSDETVLERYTSRVVSGDTPPADDGMDDLGAFGWLRGVRDRAIMLELRHKNGSVTAFAYAWLRRISFDPSIGLTLDFSGEMVRVIGRNLNAEQRPRIRLLTGILRHRVTWIQQADGVRELAAERSETVIEAFEIR